MINYWMKYTFFGNENEFSMQSDSSIFGSATKKKKKGKGIRWSNSAWMSIVAQGGTTRRLPFASIWCNLVSRSHRYTWNREIEKLGEPCTCVEDNYIENSSQGSWSSMTKKAISKYNQSSADLWQRNPVIIPKGMAQFGINNRAHVSDHDQSQCRSASLMNHQTTYDNVSFERFVNFVGQGQFRHGIRP